MSSKEVWVSHAKARRIEIVAEVAHLKHLSPTTLAIIGKELIDKTIAKLKDEMILYAKIIRDNVKDE